MNKIISIQVYQILLAGAFFSIAVKKDGTLWTWGLNSVDQLGAGTDSYSSSIPLQIGSGYSSITAGGAHSLALKTDNTLWVWGWNVYGQLGIGPGWTSHVPVRIGGD